MSQVSAKLRASDIGLLHWCPGCEELHCIATEKPNSNGARWSWDGNLEAPSFSPSINIAWGKQVDRTFVEEEPGESGRCHYFIRSGRIEFCGDTTHALAGKTVPLPDLPDHLKD